ncbi:ATP-binding cassette domain-containing protein [Hoeflea alexandrii]|uniref:ATP-binding cassette domain-containing protein n=1 Tax=Hoeflea alexandrii TaxID=288436 RepID=UPI003CCDD9CF
MKAAPLLSIDNLTGGYGEIVIVTDLSLALSQGQALCVTGRNGVGKSTLARLVTGSLMPASGQVVFLGEDLTFAPAHGRARQGMGYAPQEGVVFDTLSVAENLTLHHRDRSLERYKELFAMFPRLPDRLGQRAGTLSGGEKDPVLLPGAGGGHEAGDPGRADRRRAAGKHRADGRSDQPGERCGSRLPDH